MTTILTFIGIIALFMIGKFIYDTYLTNNTGRDWNQYKILNPHEATVLENNKGLSFKTDYSVRKDGIYVCRYDGVSAYNEPYKVTVYLAFNQFNRVFIEDAEGFPEIDKTIIKEVLKDIDQETELNRKCAEYFVNKGKISMKFVSTPDHAEEYTGSIIKMGLILNKTVYYWDENLGKQNTHNRAQNMRFEFISPE